MPTALELKPEEWRRFNPVRKRVEHHTTTDILRARKKRAFNVAHEAASILRNGFGASKVVIFGSMVTEEYFHSFSDIDLAAWGIPSDRFYNAVAAVTGISSEFKIDLVEPDNCREMVRQSIIKYGIQI